MKVTVEMTAEEFQEFCEYRKDRSMYKAKIDGLVGKMEFIAKKVNWSVEPDPKKPGKYKIVDQDHMDELYELVGDILS